ncbi:MAG: 2-oxo acid dehydrogenase subunit E2 [Kiritimatiellae bacterium]|nr:2-oxo acid dehydrogenase subunit E2 [Kiritimatiellia bacterium]
MAQPVIMPKFGQTVEDVTIVRWLKKEGDEVRKGDILFEVETEKAVLEAPSFHEGTLLKILVPEGASVRVMGVVAYIGHKGENVPETPAEQAASPDKPFPRKTVQVLPSSQNVPPRQPAVAPPRPSPPQVPPPPARLCITPRARILARNMAIDPTPIKGTGPNGRILERDVLEYLSRSGYHRIRITPAAKQLAVKEGVNILTVRGSGEGGQITVADVRRAMEMRPRKMTRLRQVIARRMTESFTTTPHFYVTVSADMTGVLGYRQQLKAEGVDLSVTDFILEAVVLSLVEFPIVNSSTDGTHVRWHGSVDLGLAVNVEGGLVVPVIRNAEALTLRQLHAAAETLARRAREGKLTPDEMTGSSFTVSNMGMLDVENFLAIINPGEAAILAVASAREVPTVVSGRLEIRSLMKMTLSADHRIVDGATGAAFVNAVKNKLEDIELWKRLTWL